MQVDLAREVFCEADALPDVLNLLRRFAEGPHDWVADPATIEAAKQYLSEQAPHLADTYIDLAHKGVVAAAWSSGSDSRTVVRIEPSYLLITPTCADQRCSSSRIKSLTAASSGR